MKPALLLNSLPRFFKRALPPIKGGTARHGVVLAAGAVALLGATAPAPAATDLGTEPLPLQNMSQVHPNLMLILDDSSSMTNAFMPDDLGGFYPDGVTSFPYAQWVGYWSPECNGVAYDPNQTYLAPVYINPDGTVGQLPAADIGNFDAADAADGTGGAYDDGYCPINGGTGCSKSNLADGTHFYYVYNPDPNKTGNAGTPAMNWTYKQITDNVSPYLSYYTPINNKFFQSYDQYNASYQFQPSPYHPQPNASPGTAFPQIANTVCQQIIYGANSALLPTIPDPTQPAPNNLLPDGGNFTLHTVSLSDSPAQQQNYLNWYSYYRTRINMLRSNMGRVMSGLQPEYRLGVTVLSDSNVQENNDTPPYTYSYPGFRNVDEFQGDQKIKIFNTLYGFNPPNAQTNTPTRASLAKVGKYFADKAPGQNTDPVQSKYTCQRNFALVATDGYWNNVAEGSSVSGVSYLPSKLDAMTYVGEQDSGDGDYNSSGEPNAGQGEVPPMQDVGLAGTPFQYTQPTTNETDYDNGTKKEERAAYTGTVGGQYETWTTCSAPTQQTTGGTSTTTCSGGDSAGTCTTTTTGGTTYYSYTKTTTTITQYSNAGDNDIKLEDATVPCYANVVSYTTIGSGSPTQSSAIWDLYPYNNPAPYSSGWQSSSTDPNNFAENGVWSCNENNPTLSGTVLEDLTAINPDATFPSEAPPNTSGWNSSSQCPTGSTSSSASKQFTINGVSCTATFNYCNVTTSSQLMTSATNTTSCSSPDTGVQTVTSIPISVAQVSCGDMSTPTYTLGASNKMGPYTQPASPIAGSGSNGTTGDSNTLADVAEYYYRTNLRSGQTPFKTTADPNGDNVMPAANSATDSTIPNPDLATWQHMDTYTLGLGVSGTIAFDPNYEQETATSSPNDFYNIWHNFNASIQGHHWPEPDNWLATCSNPNFCGGSPANTDDLWHAAMDGRGQYYSIQKSSDLVSDMDKFFTVIMTLGANGAAALSSSQLVAGGDNRLYQVSYSSGTWTGNVDAFKLDPTTGNIDPNGSTNPNAPTPLWDAQANLDADFSSSAPDLSLAKATRHIYLNGGSGLVPFNLTSLSGYLSSFNLCPPPPAFVPAQCAPGVLNAVEMGAATSPANLINYLSGARFFEAANTTPNDGNTPTTQPLYRTRSALLGDIVDGGALPIGKSPFSYGDTGYNDFKNGIASTRRTMVYAAANDGMLHAFADTADPNAAAPPAPGTEAGAEKWAFVPTAVIPNLYRLADTAYTFNHEYLVDGTPVMGDVQDSSGTWHTILVGGLNGGGKSYYALDITNPANNPPSLLWEVMDSANLIGSTQPIDNLGYSYGQAVITKCAACFPGSKGGWVVAVTSGYNNADGHGHLFILDAIKGTLLRDFDTGAGTPDAPSGLAQIQGWVDDPTSNNQTRYYYGGDLQGNLWRFDIDSCSTPTCSGSPAVQLLATLKDAGGTPQPITTAPMLDTISGQHVVIVGTGQYLGMSDLLKSNSDGTLTSDSTRQQSIYAIKDPQTSTPAVSSPPGWDPATGWGNPRDHSIPPGTSPGFVYEQLTIDGATTPPSATLSGMESSFDWTKQDGWYVDFGTPGERLAVNMTLEFGTLVAVTTIPPNQDDPCAHSGSTWMYQLDALTGGIPPGASNAGNEVDATSVPTSNTYTEFPPNPLGSGSSSGVGGSTTQTNNGCPPGFVTVATSGNTTASGFHCSSQSSTTQINRISWRELVN